MIAATIVWVIMVWQVPQDFYMPEHAYMSKWQCEDAAKAIPRGYGVKGNPAPPICMALRVESPL